jgi:hypothetical protein
MPARMPEAPVLSEALDPARAESQGSVSRVLVVSPNWLGDAVMALPAIADVKRHFHAARLVVAARRSVADVFRLAAPAKCRPIAATAGSASTASPSQFGGRTSTRW